MLMLLQAAHKSVFTMTTGRRYSLVPFPRSYRWNPHQVSSSAALAACTEAAGSFSAADEVDSMEVACSVGDQHGKRHLLHEHPEHTSF